MSTWSIPLGRYAGIALRVHITFFLLLLWYWLGGLAAGGQKQAFVDVFFIVAIFTCVVVHEFAHALMALYFGIKTRDITLWPIGGVANVERIPEAAREELLITLAGPATNLLIAFILAAAFGISLNNLWTLEHMQDLSFVEQLALANIVLAVFNLIPAFPMDGGRILRALLATTMDRVRATHIAARTGQVIAFGFGLLALFGNPLLLLIAFFVFFGAAQESHAVDLRAVARGLPALSAAAKSFATLDPNTRVSEAARLLLDTYQKDFPVVDAQGVLQGVLTREGMIHALSEVGPNAPISSVMQKEVPTVGQNSVLELAIEQLSDSGKPMVGVTDSNGKVVGMITLENIAELLMVSAAGKGVPR